MSQISLFIAFLKTSGLFDSLVAACSFQYSSPNAPSKRDVPRTALLSVLAGHRRYAHITALRADTVNPPLLGMNRVLSEDAIRWGFERIEASAGVTWLNAIGRRTTQAGETTIHVGSTYSKHAWVRSAFTRIGVSLEAPRLSAEQLTPLQRWYRILSAHTRQRKRQ